MSEGRVWYITVCGEYGNRIDWQTFYDRDQVAEFLNDMDIKGYCMTECSFSCVHDSEYLVRVELELRFCNFQIANIADELERILGKEGC